MIPFGRGGPHGRELVRFSKRIDDDLLTVDLLLLPEFLGEVWKSRQTYELDGAPITAVSADGLIAMKRVAGRHQDWSDVEHLERGR